MNTYWTLRGVFFSLIWITMMSMTYAQTYRVEGNFLPNSPGSDALMSVNIDGNWVEVQHDPLGSYYFDAPEGSSFEIKPYLNTNTRNGVNVLDILLIQRHILGIERLDSPYKLIAADANNIGTITVQDLVEIRRVILSGLNFRNNTSWRFVTAVHLFNAPQNAHAESFPESIEIQSIMADTTGLDFIAIKVGDVNNSVVLNAQPHMAVRGLGVELITEEQNLKAGNEYRVEFRSEHFAQMEGYQFTMRFNPNKLGFVGYEPGVLDLSDDHFGFDYLKEGMITSLWYTLQSVDANNSDVLFTMIFQALSDTNLSEVLQLNSDFLEAMAVCDGNPMGLHLVFAPKQSAIGDTGFTLLQNAPNPFSTETSIEFTLPESMHATFSIFDVTGKLLKVISGNFAKGMNTISLQKSELPQSGLLYYQLEAEGFKATKKMLVVE